MTNYYRDLVIQANEMLRKNPYVVGLHLYPGLYFYFDRIEVERGIIRFYIKDRETGMIDTFVLEPVRFSLF